MHIANIVRIVRFLPRRLRVPIGASLLVLVVGSAVLSWPHGVSKQRQGPSVHAVGTDVKLGVVRPMSEVEAVFEISNRGSEPILFGKPKTTCTCMKPRLPTDQLKPGRSMVITVRLKARTTLGPFRDWVELPTNDPTTPILKLTIVGEVWPVILASPRQIIFAPLRVGDERSQRIELSARDGKGFSIETVAIQSRAITVDYTPDAPAPTQRLLVTFRPQAGDDRVVNDEIVVTIDHPQLDEIRLPGSAQGRDPIVAIPERLVAVHGRPRAIVRREVELEGATEVPRVVSVGSADDVWTLVGWSMKASDATNRVALFVDIALPNVPGYHQGSLLVTCEDGDAGPNGLRVTVPFAGLVRDELERGVAGAHQPAWPDSEPAP